ncbi:MAG: NnrS family protein [Pseudomonadota bacterium]
MAGGVPSLSFPVVQWHAREMFFGFGWAVMGGFLLTATKNWVRVRGYHGPPLVFLAAACWFACFSLLAWRYLPFLARPRVDGKEH